jgi:hypothetical protein
VRYHVEVREIFACWARQHQLSPALRVQEGALHDLADHDNIAAVRGDAQVHASHREQRWEPPSASLIERDPEVIPDVDLAAKVGKDLFLDEKIPRHESGQGYVRVVEHSVLWKEKEASKVFTYQGLTTCAEVDKRWTIMSSAYNHVRSKRGKDEHSMAMFIRKEVEHQERCYYCAITQQSCALSRSG